MNFNLTEFGLIFCLAGWFGLAAMPFIQLRQPIPLKWHKTWATTSMAVMLLGAAIVVVSYFFKDV